MTLSDLIKDAVDQFGPEKMRMPVIVALCISCVYEVASPVINKYIFNDIEFAVFLAGLITLDTLTGVWKAYKLNRVSSKRFGAVITKVLVYGIFSIVIHALESFSDKDMVKSAFDWLGSFGYAAMMVREAISVIENLGAIQKGLIPSWILNKLKDFDEDGKFNDPSA